jgi:hypothetical protein
MRKILHIFTIALQKFTGTPPSNRRRVIASEAKQSRVRYLMRLLDRHGGQGRLAMTARNYLPDAVSQG